MEPERSHVTKKILNLTLEIIYLLTGEDYGPIKKLSDHVRPPSLIFRKGSNKKVLEVTQKIIELLTGEVPIRCQDVSVSFSLKEWEHLEGHKDARIKNEPSLTSPDGSRNRNTSERCPRPLYSRDSTQEHHEIPQARPLYSRDSTQEHHEIPQTRPLYSRDSTQEHHEIPQARPLYSRDSTQEHQEIPQSRPLYSRDSTQEHQEISQEDQKDNLTEYGDEDGEEETYTRDNDWSEEDELPSETQDKCCSPLYSRDLQGETLLDIKVEVKEEEEELYVRVEEPCEEDDVPPEISTDGSRNRNTPERCPRPLYSWDSAQEHQEIPQARPLYSWDSTQEHHAIPQDDLEENVTEDGEEETYIRDDEQSEEEEVPSDTQDRCCSPLYSGDLQEDYKILRDYQGETLMDIKVEVKEEEEELYVSGEEPCKEEEIPPDISTGGPQSRNRWSTFTPRGGGEDDDLLGDPQGANSMALYLQPRRHMVGLSSDPSIYEMSFPGHSRSVDYHQMGNTFPFPERRECIIKSEGIYSHSNYGKSFIQNCLLQRHQPNHTWGNPYSCSECGKSFKLKSAFLRHKRTHTEERPFSCTECGKSFSQRAHLVSHERIHTGVKPYCCSECGKCFSHKISLITHESFHTGVKPFFCSECGKQFSRKSVLILHERVHTGEKPYPCPECGKCFSQRTHLNTHRRSHTSERPFSCSECGKTYSRKSYLVDHLRTHTGVKPYACSVCGKCFSCKSNLITHQTIHSSKKPFSCTECGKCFQTRSAFTYHKKLHAADKIPLC